MTTQSFPPIHPLEPRLLLTVQFVDGTIQVTGTPNSDQLEARLLPGKSGKPDDDRIIILDNGRRSAFRSSVVIDVVLDGLAGDDRLIAGPGFAATLIGGRGADSLSADATSKIAFLNGGPGPDDIRGRGFVALDYTLEEQDLTIIIDGLANDGRPGERDNINVRGALIIGGQGNDLFSDPFSPTGAGSAFFRENGRSPGNSFSAGQGNDTLLGGPGPDQFSGGLGDDMLIGRGGNDELDDGSAGNNTLVGGDGADFFTLTAPDGNNLLQGGGGDDFIGIAPSFTPETAVRTGRNTIFGGDGDDLFVQTGRTRDRISGGDGFDTLNFTSRTTPISITFDNKANDGASDERDLLRSDIEAVLASQANDTLTGDQRDNLFFGLEGNDVLRGEAGRDILLGGDGRDSLFGDLGTDFFVNADQEDDVVDGGPGLDFAQANLSANRSRRGVISEPNDTLDRIEIFYDDATPASAAALAAAFRIRRGQSPFVIDSQVLTIMGEDDADQITLQRIGDTLRLRIDGRSDNIPAADVRAVQIFGQGGDDILNCTGLSLPCTLIGGRGSDTLLGGAAGDSLAGGAGNDSLAGRGGNDLFTADGGADTLSGGGGDSDTADYSDRSQPLSLSLNALPDDGVANERDNLLPDIENILSGGGDDRITGSPSANFIFGGAGNDTIFGAGGNDILGGSDDRDRVFGQPGNDFLFLQDQFRDTLDGGAGLDQPIRDMIDRDLELEGPA